MPSDPVWAPVHSQARWRQPPDRDALAGADPNLSDGGGLWLAGPALSPRAFRALPVAAVVCAAIALVGIIEVRRGATGRRDLTPLFDLVTHLQPDGVEGGFYLAGNVKMRMPDLDVRNLGETAALGDWPKHLLVLGDLPLGVSVLDEGEMTLVSPAYPPPTDGSQMASFNGADAN